MSVIAFIAGLVLGWYARRKLVDGRIVGPIAGKDAAREKP